MAMNWTTKQPTKAGFYWYRDKNRTVVLEVRDSFVKGKMLAWDWQQGGCVKMTSRSVWASGIEERID
jgi:hypothetical protein